MHDGQMLNTLDTAPQTSQALAGLKVLDFGWALVGSITGKYLGDHGAEVIRVESATRPDMTRVDRRFSKSSRASLDDKPWFAHVNSSKRSLAINLKRENSREVILELIKWADIVNENFTPGTLAQLGFSWELIHELNPKAILISGSLFGQTGHLANQWGIDGTGAAISGRLQLSGWPDRTPVTPNVGIFGDYVVPYMNCIAALGTLISQKRDDAPGAALDVAMFEVAAQVLTPAFLDFQENGVVQNRMGNRMLHMAPHGVFPCEGDDEWIAIAVENDADWLVLCAELGLDDLAADPALLTLAGRKADEDRIEAAIAAVTAGQNKHALMHGLQAAGLAAGGVMNMAEMVDQDPQLAERKFLHPVDHAILGPFGHQVAPFRLSETPAQPRPAPAMGADNHHICTEILKMDDEKFVDLMIQDIFQ